MVVDEYGLYVGVLETVVVQAMTVGADRLKLVESLQQLPMGDREIGPDSQQYCVRALLQAHMYARVLEDTGQCQPNGQVATGCEQRTICTLLAAEPSVV